MKEVAFDLPPGRMHGVERAGEDVPGWRNSMRKITKMSKWRTCPQGGSRPV